jgi:8-oxoguanine deaminase
METNMGNTVPRTKLFKNIQVLVTMDDERRELRDAALFVEDNRISAVGPTTELPHTADEVIDLKGHLVIPGLVNTHHHMYESLTRAIPAVQNSEFFGWVTSLYKIWERLTPEMIEVSTLTAMAQLMLSGCTTTSDHMYMFPNGVRVDDGIASAQRIGMRFHASRGSLSILQSDGGLAPDAVVQTNDVILKDTQRVIEAYNDNGRYAMLRVVVAPATPFAVSADLMRESARLARHHGVSMHTHLAESAASAAYTHKLFGKTAAEYVEGLGWTGPDVWHAHCVGLDRAGIDLFGRTDTGVSHCPCTEMRLSMGIAPIRAMRDAGVPVGLGVDGSASNDGPQMLGAARQTMLLQRVGSGHDAMSPREALEIGTLGGAKVLNRDDIGSLKPGMAADFVSYDLNQLAFAGALHDPVAALVLCNPPRVSTSVIGGKVVVKDGTLTTVDLGPVIERHNKLASSLVNG